LNKDCNQTFQAFKQSTTKCNIFIIDFINIEEECCICYQKKNIIETECFDCLMNDNAEVIVLFVEHI
jgi:hypothetical protein